MNLCLMVHNKTNKWDFDSSYSIYLLMHMTHRQQMHSIKYVGRYILWWIIRDWNFHAHFLCDGFYDHDHRLFVISAVQHWSWKVKRYVESMTIILSTFLLLLLLETVATRGFNWRVCHANCEIFGFSIESWRRSSCCCNNFHPSQRKARRKMTLLTAATDLVAWLQYKKIDALSKHLSAFRKNVTFYN